MKPIRVGCTNYLCQIVSSHGLKRTDVYSELKLKNVDIMITFRLKTNHRKAPVNGRKTNEKSSWKQLSSCTQ